MSPVIRASVAMDEAYDKAVPNLLVMVRDVEVAEALHYKARLKGVPGVTDVNWLDDQVNLKVPLETQDKTTIADWYAEGNALFYLMVAEAGQQETLAAIREIIGEEGAMSGNPVDTVASQNSTQSEIGRMMLIILPAALAILLFTSSWAEPFLLFLNLGVAIAINMGTNLILGEISFVTNTIDIVLQLACFIGYSIFNTLKGQK